MFGRVLNTALILMKTFTVFVVCCQSSNLLLSSDVLPEAVKWRYSIRKMFFKISQNSQVNSQVYIKFQSSVNTGVFQKF